MCKLTIVSLTLCFCRYVRSDSWFWNISRKLCSTRLIASLDACPHPSGLTRATLQLTPVALTAFPHHFPSCLACCISQNERLLQGHGSYILLVCLEVSACFSEFERKERMLMILFQRMNYFVPQLFAAAGNLHSFPLNSTAPKVSYCVTLHLVVFSPQYHHKPHPLQYFLN